MEIQDIENPAHLDIEDKEYNGLIYPDDTLRGIVDYPDNLEHACGQLNTLAENSDFVNSFEETITLYRGDSRANLEEFGYDFDNNTVTDEALTREFPLYFTTSEEEATSYANRKGSEDVYLIELNVPFDSLELLRDLTPEEVARNYEQLDLDDSNMYFNQSSHLRSSLEWVSCSVPEDWLNDLEKL